MTFGHFTAFQGVKEVAAGELADVARAVATLDPEDGPTIVLENATGRVVDLDLRFGPDAAARRWQDATSKPSPPPARRGRPRLGVVAREVTLLPRHWEWLAGQPGGASAALRRLVEEARRSTVPADQARQAREVAYRAMSVLAGDLPAFEDAARALFAGDTEGVLRILKTWPPDIASFLASLPNGEPG